MYSRRYPEFVPASEFAGGVNPDDRSGDFMLITEHITTRVPSLLTGTNPEKPGVRFPDMRETLPWKAWQDMTERSRWYIGC